MPDLTKFVLSEDQMPISLAECSAAAQGADGAAAPSRPRSSPSRPEDLLPIFPMSLIEQEMSMQKEIDIPGEVIDIYRLWRPTPLYRARRLEKAARHAGTHLLQVRGRQPRRQPQAQHRRFAQAYYNKKAGIKRLATETGAGQWGSALSLACQPVRAWNAPSTW